MTDTNSQDVPPALAGVTHHQVPVSTGITLHVAEAGPADGPAVLLLHGWPQNWWMWRHLIPVLAGAGFRVLAPDLRGFGWSDAPPTGYRKDELARDVQALMDALGLEKVAVVGHDWGGYVAYLLAGWEPERVTKLVALSIPSPHARAGAKDISALRGLAHMPLLSAPLVGHRIAGSKTFLRIVERAANNTPGAWNDVDRNIYVERWTDHPERARAATQVYRTFVTQELGRPPAAPRPTQPVLALHGDRDPVKPSLNKGADIIAGAGHLPAEEAPATVNDRILTFLRT